MAGLSPDISPEMQALEMGRAHWTSESSLFTF